MSDTKKRLVEIHDDDKFWTFMTDMTTVQIRRVYDDFIDDDEAYDFGTYLEENFPSHCDRLYVDETIIL